MEVPISTRMDMAEENLDKVFQCIGCQRGPDFRLSDSQCMDVLGLFVLGCSSGKFRVDDISWKEIVLLSHGVMGVVLASSGRQREEWEEKAKRLA